MFSETCSFITASTLAHPHPLPHPHTHSPVSLWSRVFLLNRSRALQVEYLMCSLKDLFCRSSRRMDLDIFSCSPSVLDSRPPSPLSRVCRSLLIPFSMSGSVRSAAVCIREFPLQCSHIQSCTTVCVCVVVGGLGTECFPTQASAPPQCEYFKKPYLCNLSALTRSLCVSFKLLLVFMLSVCIGNI